MDYKSITILCQDLIFVVGKKVNIFLPDNQGVLLLNGHNVFILYLMISHNISQ